MSNKGRDFPQYRKLFNEKAFYKIIDDRNFEEIQLMGSRKMTYAFTAEKYPEILRIQDMLDLEPGYLECDPEEYEGLMND
ncbi:MAG: hypothetical protein P8P74_11570 [Crocinitomicaceae bacterium]|nr:hypothetical protein [Crocinitomicaceae bacterium]